MSRKIAQLVVACAVGLFPYVGQAFGISPAVVEINNLLPESNVTTSIYISRANPDTIDTATVSVSGSGVAAMVLPQTSITLPVGETNVPFTFSIQPASLATGTYKVAMTFLYTPTNTMTTGSTTVQSGIEATIQFSVTDQAVTQLNIDGVEIVTANDGTAQLEYTVTNTGNTASSPSKITIEYTDNTASDIAITTVVETELPAVPPFTNQTERLTINNTLSAGLYTMTTTFYDATDHVLLTVPLHVQVPNDVTTPLLTTAEQPTQWWLWSIGIGLGCIILIVLGYAKMAK